MKSEIFNKINELNIQISFIRALSMNMLKDEMINYNEFKKLEESLNIYKNKLVKNRLELYDSLYGSVYFDNKQLFLIEQPSMNLFNIWEAHAEDEKCNLYIIRWNNNPYNQNKNYIKPYEVVSVEDEDN